MDNIILIGMSGAGKSTLGVLLAKSLNFDFVDTDILIQRKAGKVLKDIISEFGIEKFKGLEEEVIIGLNGTTTVFATGGSVIYSEKGMKVLQELGTVIYIDVPIEDIKKRISNISTRGIVMEENQTLESLFIDREYLYKKYADFTMEVKGLTIEETIEQLIADIQHNKLNL